MACNLRTAGTNRFVAVSVNGDVTVYGAGYGATAKP